MASLNDWTNGYGKCYLCGAPIKKNHDLHLDREWVHYWGDGDYLYCDRPTHGAMTQGGYERRNPHDPTRMASDERDQARLI